MLICLVFWVWVCLWGEVARLDCEVALVGLVELVELRPRARLVVEEFMGLRE